jgi:regulator of sigma E protease
MSGVIWVVVAFSGYIFIHELGHFLAAKRVGVRVEVFSIGFGPFIFSFRRGDTVYAVSWIPLGGYVKMAGQSDLGPDPNSGKPYEYSSKPAFQRMQIAVAGVIMNFIGGFAAFVAAYLVGVYVVPAVAQEVELNSPAAEAGLHPGDKVIAFNGSPVWSSQDLDLAFLANRDRPAVLSILEPGGQEREIRIRPRVRDGKLQVGIATDEAVYIGVDAEEKGVVIQSVVRDKPAGEAGIEPLDVVASANGVSIESPAQLQKVIWDNGLDTLVITVLRQGAPIELAVDPVIDKKTKKAVIGVALGSTYHVTHVYPDSTAASAGIVPGDDILYVRGQVVMPKDLEPVRKVDLVAECERGGVRIEIKLEVPRTEKRGTAIVHVSFRQFLRLGFVDSIVAGWYKTVDFTLLVGTLVKGMFTGQFGTRDLAGPLGVVAITYEASRAGIGALLLLFGLVSVNLGVINMFPMPPLDGGLLVFLIYEKFRGKPLPRRVQEGFLLVGIVLLLVLVVFVTKNDIVRFLGGGG